MNRKLLLLIVALASLALPLGHVAAEAEGPAAPPVGETLTGVLTVVSGDPMDMGAPGAAPIERFFLTTGSGATVELQIDPAARTFDLYRLNGQQVTVSAAATAAPATAGSTPVVAVRAVVAANPSAPAPSTAVLGNTKWLTIACKFPDVAAEPEPLSYFQNMYAATYPGLDHYWREASYGAVDLGGSRAVGWYALPRPRSYYMVDANYVYLDRIFTDCAAQADPDVYFPDYYGIQFFLNDSMG